MILKTVVACIIILILMLIISKAINGAKDDIIDYAEYDEPSKILTAVFKSGKVLKYRLRDRVWKLAKDNSNVGIEESDTLDYIKDYINAYGNPFPKSHLKKMNYE